jgi:uncharacterized protein (DUF2267 family)
MIVTTDDFASHVVAHAGVATTLAARATPVVLAGIGAFLGPAARQLVASELPPELGAAVVAGSDLATPIEERVLAFEAKIGHARELIASVCRVLAEELSTEALAALHAAVPAKLAVLLDASATNAAPPPPGSNRPRDTLADGRPGSHHPVSSAHRPGAQRESLAADNPHAATKLSSTTGTTQERHCETLAEGRPGPPYPITGSRD